MNYPIISEYIEAIKAAEENLAQLKQLRPVLEEDGQPVMSSGNFAVVFKMKDEQTGKLYAVKCFLKEQEGRAEAYRLIAEELEYVSSTFLTPIKYLDKELFVDTGQTTETEFPVLLMDWVEGETLDKYIRKHLDDQYELSLLAYQFSRLAMWLMPQPFAHGDLKPDNILVKEDGTLVLVDYDGMYVPAMKGQRARELGSPDFRHPSRTEDAFDEHIDDFSLVSILLSLKAIALQPELLEQYGASDRLLFSANDYRNLSESQVMDTIKAMMQDSELATLYSLFILSSAQNNMSQASFRLLNLNRPQVLECENLNTQVTEEDFANAWTDEFGVIYSRDKSVLLKYSPSDVTGICYTISSTCKEIGKCAFFREEGYDEDGHYNYGNNLITLIIPLGIEKIGDYAFDGCDNISTMFIPKSVKKIGVLSVGGTDNKRPCFVWVDGEPIIKEICKNIILVVSRDYYDEYKEQHPENRIVINPQNYPLTDSVCIDKIIYDTNLDWVLGCTDDCPDEIIIEQNVVGIAPHAFHNRMDIKSVILPPELLFIGEKAFYHSSLNLIDIPGNVVYIGISAFEYCKDLHEVHLPDELNEICNVCFSNCYNLKAFSLPKYCLRIGSGAFSGSGITKIVIPSNVRVIDMGAFRWCHDLKTIDIWDSSFNMVIKDKAFNECESIEYFLLPFYDCVIEEHTFGDMPHIKLLCRNGAYDYHIPNNIKDIVVTLGDLSGTKSSQIYNLVEKIRKRADLTTEVSPVDLLLSYEDEFGVKYSPDKKRILFASKPLSSYVIPEGTEIISSFAFEENSIYKIEFPKSLKIIGDDAFRYCTQLKEINLPANIDYLGESIFFGCSSLEKIWYNCELDNLPNSIFGGCSSLRNIDLKNTQLKKIGTHSFNSCLKLEVVSLPDCLETIDHHAFAYCECLKSISIPKNVKTIGWECFKNCSNLSSFILTNGNIQIDTLAFWGCSSLSCISIPIGYRERFEKMWPNWKDILVEQEKSDNLKTEVTKEDLENAWTDEFGVKYSADRKRLLKAPKDLTEYAIKKGTKVICNGFSSHYEWGRNVTGAFNDCALLQSLTIPDSVTTIGNVAFSGCKSLKELYIPDSVIEIGAGAFRDCKNLKSINIPNDIKVIADEVLYNCTGLTSIIIPYSVTKIGRCSFKFCEGLSSIIIPKEVGEIGEEAFSNCINLRSVTLSSEIKNIGNDIFNDCRSLDTINMTSSHYMFGQSQREEFGKKIPKHINLLREVQDTEMYSTGINNYDKIHNFKDEFGVVYSEDGKRLLWAPEELKEYSIREGTKYICNYSFSDCTHLVSVAIPNSVKEIGDHSFSGCYSIKSIQLPNSITQIGTYAFSGCKMMATIVLSKRLDLIAQGVFQYCKNLKRIDIPNNVSKISYHAFEWCGITSIYIPESIKCIDSGAFSGCPDLESIIVDKGNAHFDSRNNCNAIVKQSTLVVGCRNTLIPLDVVTIGESAFAGCLHLKKITIPSSIKGINAFAFDACVELESLEIPQGVTNIGSSAFSGCQSLISIVFPPSINKIGWHALWNCPSLQSIYIPKGSRKSFEVMIPSFERNGVLVEQ